ncbi:hypothetical protein EON65_11410 [archaeon]|nr:MAG: hypothetical protein EON65_11410 [archaeon]
MTLSIHSSQHSEWSEEGQDDYRIAPDSEEFRLALAGCLAMTLAFICNWILDVIHYFKSTDHTNTVQLGLNQISMRTQFIILLALIVPCSLLFIYPHRTMFWVLTHIQTHTLLQIGYHYIQRVFCQDGGSWEMLLFPCLLFTAGIAHYLSVLEGGSMHTALITITAASSLVAILVILGLGKSIYKQLLTNMKESGQLIPEEQQALRFVFVLSSWLLAYAISMLVISGNYMVDFCLVHTIFVGILGFALSMCNSVKSKQAALLAEVRSSLYSKTNCGLPTYICLCRMPWRQNASSCATCPMRSAPL